jgi:hypothetical protein
MTVSWTLGETELSNYGKVTAINDYLDAPERRGSNILVPFRHGTIHQKKFYDERHFVFGITIISDTAENLEAALDTLKGAIAPRDTQVLSMTMEDASVREIDVTVDAPLQVERFGNNVAKVVLDFTACSPFWRSDTEIEENITTIDESPKEIIVDNTGTVEERDPRITLTGPLKDTVITNSNNGLTLTYTGTIDEGEVVVIQTADSGEYTAVMEGVGTVVGNLTHSGDSALMVFEVGENTLSVTDETATTGTIQITFYPPFI